MMYRECKSCGCAMDPGEGQNGICEECVERQRVKLVSNRQLDVLVRCRNYKQMSFEDFLEARCS